MSGWDIKRELKALYAPKNVAWALVDVPPQRFIGVDGVGDPNSAEAYADAVQALYAVAYTLKFAHRERPFTVGPLEGLWWADDPRTFVTREKAAWKWTMLVSLPPWLADDDGNGNGNGNVDAAKAVALAKKKLPAIEKVRVVELNEGRCAQVLHVGPYDDEGPKLAQLHGAFFAEHGLTFNGLHHEIYLSDPRRVEPAKLKTILRQPVKSRG